MLVLGKDGLFINRVYNNPIQRVAVIGERSSGTNTSDYMVTRALGLPSSDALGWKHGFVQGAGISKDTLVLVSVRDPYDWIASMYDKPWHCADAMRSMGFSDFIRSPWDSEIDKPRVYFGLPALGYAKVPLLQDRDPLTGLRFENLLRMRTTKLRHWVGLANNLCNLAVWRFETFKQNHEAFLNLISESFNTERHSVTWPEQQMGAMRAGRRQGRISAFRPEDIAFINSQIDPDLENSLGYSLRTPDF